MPYRLFHHEWIFGGIDIDIDRALPVRPAKLSQCCALDSQMRNESNDIRFLFTEAKLLNKLKCLSKDSYLDEVTISSEPAFHLIPNELYNFVAWLVSEANEETEQNGSVLISAKKD